MLRHQTGISKVKRNRKPPFLGESFPSSSLLKAVEDGDRTDATRNHSTHMSKLKNYPYLVIDRVFISISHVLGLD